MKLIILDRDGVINYDSLDYIKTPSEWQAIPGSLEAIARLNQLEYRIAIATNQAGIGRGLYCHDDLTAIHQKMLSELSAHGAKIDKITFCPHRPEDDCLCRKPKPGLLNEIANHFNLSLDGVPMLGDRLSDMQAAQAAGAKPIFIKSAMEAVIPKDIPIYESLSEFVSTL